MRIRGFATPKGTENFKRRFEGRIPSQSFRPFQGLFFSSIGAGSYLGEPDSQTDSLYEEGLKTAVLSGVNVIDSAINYRCQRSERVIGKVLKRLIDENQIHREGILLCTKGGYLPFDGDFPEDPEGFLLKTYVEPGTLSPKEIVQGCHAMTPAYLKDQLERSLNNLGAETIDIYYLHNPETQLSQLDRREFLGRLKEAFEFLEEQVSQGLIRMYGTATWNGYRAPCESREHLCLQEIQILAREVAGPNHHFKVVQLPINLGLPEAWISQNQKYGAGTLTFLEVAQRLGVGVVASASLLQGKLTRPLPELKRFFPALKTSAQVSLQFVRSLPGVITALVGMKTKEHVLENCQTLKEVPLSEAELAQIFQKV